VQIIQSLKSEIKSNAVWPFAVAFILVNEFGHHLFNQPSVVDFLVSNWYMPTFIVSVSFIAYLFLIGLVDHHKRYAPWVPQHRYRSWKLRVAFGASGVITMEMVSILIFFLCLFLWSWGVEPTKELQSWLYADMVFGLIVAPIIGKYYFWSLKKQF